MDKLLYSTNNKLIFGTGGKLVYGVDLLYYLKVQMTFNSYSYYVPFFDSYKWGTATVSNQYIGDPTGWWGTNSPLSISPVVNHYTPRVFTFLTVVKITESTTPPDDAGRVFSDGTWYFPLSMRTNKVLIYRDDGGVDPVPIPREIRVDAYAHIKATIYGRFNDIKVTETDLLFGVDAEANYTIAWTPATKTLSIG